jgi:hypothetical protein
MELLIIVCHMRVFQSNSRENPRTSIAVGQYSNEILFAASTVG